MPVSSHSKFFEPGSCRGRAIIDVRDRMTRIAFSIHFQGMFKRVQDGFIRGGVANDMHVDSETFLV